MMDTRSYGCFPEEQEEYLRLLEFSNRPPDPLLPNLEQQSVEFEIALPRGWDKNSILVLSALYPLSGDHFVIYRGDAADRVTAKLPRHANDPDPRYIFTVELFQPERLWVCAWSTDKLAAISDKIAAQWQITLAKTPPEPPDMEMLWVAPLR